MEICKNCGKPLIMSGGKCVYCGKSPNGQINGEVEESLQQNFPPVRTFNVNGVSFNMILVEGGTFWMGAQANNPQDRNYDSESKGRKDGYLESPVHEVSLSSFYIGETVITQSLWEAFGEEDTTARNGWFWPYDDCKERDFPLFNLSWYEFDSFIRRLNQYIGQEFRMPTEAEWEFAARGGNKSRNTKYAGSNNIDDVGWYWKNSGDNYLSGNPKIVNLSLLRTNNCRLHAVKEKLPNELGLYDMSGNIREYCHDLYGRYKSRHQFDPMTPPEGPNTGCFHVARGGSWKGLERECRVTHREGVPSYFVGMFGLRLCLPCKL